MKIFWSFSPHDDDPRRTQWHQSASTANRLCLHTRVPARGVSADPGSYLHRPKDCFGRISEIATNMCLLVRCVMAVRPWPNRLPDDRRFTSRVRARAMDVKRPVHRSARTRTASRGDARRPAAKSRRAQNPRRRSSLPDGHKLSPQPMLLSIPRSRDATYHLTRAMCIG